MLLSSKNDESHGIKTFEVYSYITLASNIFKQTKTFICVMVYIVEKVWIANYRQTNDVTDRPRPGRPRLSSAADDRVLARSAVRDLKAPCSELGQQWQNLNVQASTRSVNRRLNKARLKTRRPCRRTFLMLDHRCNCVQWAPNKLRWNLRT